MSYVRINESVVGPFEHQGDADKLFLMLVRTELDHPGDEGATTTFRRHGCLCDRRNE